ncbi:MAG: copper chaperone PCu(A)C [Ilumatobacteraceae bacterium]
MENMRSATSLVRRVATTGLLVGALSLTAAACGSDGGSTSSNTTSVAGTNAPEGEVGIAKQWARPTPEGATNGAVYFTILSAADDVLTGVSVDPSVAARAEIHQTMVMGSDTTAMGDTGSTMGGGMQMGPVDSVPVKAGEDFVFEPGGYHVMLFDVAKPLKVGDSITVTLTFQNAGAIPVDVPVLEEAP